MMEQAIKRIAKLLCYEKCRAGICKDDEKCWTSYPAPGYSHFEAYIAEAKKLIALAGQVPEGWKLVPIEPDEAMLYAARHESEIVSLPDEENYEIWSAMLAASPTPAPSPDAGRVPEKAAKAAIRPAPAADMTGDRQGIAERDERTDQIADEIVSLIKILNESANVIAALSSRPAPATEVTEKDQEIQIQRLQERITELYRAQKSEILSAMSFTPSPDAAPAAEVTGEHRENTLFKAIAHGDEVHRAWLEKAINDHFAGRPVEPVRALTAPSPDAGRVPKEAPVTNDQLIQLNGFGSILPAIQVYRLGWAACHAAVFASPSPDAGRMPDALDPHTIEECAKAAKAYVSKNISNQAAHGVASAIRSLLTDDKGSNHGN